MTDTNLPGRRERKRHWHLWLTKGGKETALQRETDWCRAEWFFVFVTVYGLRHRPPPFVSKRRQCFWPKTSVKSVKIASINSYLLSAHAAHSPLLAEIAGEWPRSNPSHLRASHQGITRSLQHHFEWLKNPAFTHLSERAEPLGCCTGPERSQEQIFKDDFQCFLLRVKMDVQPIQLLSHYLGTLLAEEGKTEE